MKPYYQDNHVRIYNKDCRDMGELEDNSAQCVVTSPPYWGLRKYSGVADLIWGDNNCRHEWVEERLATSGGREGGRAEYHRRHDIESVRGLCSLCGAWKGSYGLEPTPEMYIQHTIEILREIKRVLRSDGVVFWNIGDSYFSSGGESYSGSKRWQHTGGRVGAPEGTFVEAPKIEKHNSLKPKDLCLIPFRVAIAAQEDGWWVRSVIIWSKPNPMPESVTDRPTESHEYILMLTKSKNYYWDADAVREPLKPSTLNDIRIGCKTGRPDKKAHQMVKDGHHGSGGIGDPTKTRAELHNLAGRNIRTVWEFPTQPYPEAHFAVFPEKLPEICIKAATPEVGCCSKCGAPWERIVKRSEIDYGMGDAECDHQKLAVTQGSLSRKRTPTGHTLVKTQSEQQGWQPTCKCNAEKVPSLCLDPFLGSGTTLWVAKKLNRRAVGYELSEEYCALAVERNRQMVMEL